MLASSHQAAQIANTIGKSMKKFDLRSIRHRLSSRLLISLTLAALQGIGGTARAHPSSDPARASRLEAAKQQMKNGKAAFSAFDFKTAISDFNSAADTFEQSGDTSAASVARRQAAGAECNGLMQELAKSIAAGKVHAPMTLGDFSPRFEPACTKAGLTNIIAAARQAIARSHAQSQQEAAQPAPATDPAPASAVPACARPSASARAQNLAVIGECTVVYCAPDAEEQARTNLKHIDDKLLELQTATAETQAAWEHFKRACRAIGGNVNAKDGPASRDFFDSVMPLSLTRGQLSDLYTALQDPNSPEPRIFENTSAAMGHAYRQLACMRQINQQTNDALNAAQEIMAKIDIDCSPEIIKRW